MNRRLEAVIFAVTAVLAFFLVQFYAQAWLMALFLAISAEIVRGKLIFQDLSIATLKKRMTPFIFGAGLLVTAQLQPEISTSISGEAAPAWGAYLLLIAYLLGMAYWHRAEKDIWLAMLLAQVAGLWAIFLLIGIYNFPTVLACLLVWGLVYAVVRNQLKSVDDNRGRLIALVWAFVAAELTWVFSVWLINYIVAGGLLVVPAPALILPILWYSFAGIYRAQSSGLLSRGILTEYMGMGSALILLVLIGTKWHGGN